MKSPLRHINILLLVINILLLAFWIVPATYRLQACRSLEAAFGMKAYMIRLPFCVLVDRTFPLRDRFSFMNRNLPFVLTTDTINKGRRQLDLGIGTDFSVSSDVSIEKEASGTVLQTIVRIGRITYVDLNGDGILDMRAITSPQPVEEDVWMGNSWIPTQKGKRGAFLSDHKGLASGEDVVFDHGVGIWKRSDRTTDDEMSRKPELK